MNTKDRIIQEIETASSNLRKEVLDFILFLKSKENQTNQVEQTEVSQSVSDSEITQSKPQSPPIPRVPSKSSSETNPEQKPQQLDRSVLDLSVENRNGELILVVEVKSKTNVSTEWVSKLRSNILANNTFSKAPYFLIVFPDKLYLWKHQNEDSKNKREPDYIINANSILQPYFEQAGVISQQISGQSLEIIVASWLAEIIYSDKQPEDLDDSQYWLVESGLYSAIAGGSLKHEVVV
ncbi:MAG: hypothetical protein ABEI32_06005 [Halothece sp.]